MERKALVRTSDGLVVNLILYDPDSDWKVPDGFELQDAEGGATGDTWDGTQFVKPVPVASGATWQQQYASAWTQGGKIDVIARYLGLA